MKNKIKALELSGLQCEPNEEDYYYNGEKCMIYDSVIKALEWKEQQFKDKIEDLFNRLENEAYNERVKSGFEIFKHELMKNNVGLNYDTRRKRNNCR